LRVIKSDGRVQAFQTDKLKESIRKAYGKHEVDDQIEDIAVRVLLEIIRLSQAEVFSKDIGNAVERHLRPDPVAFVRYAAIHRHSEDIRDLEMIVKEATGYVEGKRPKEAGDQEETPPSSMNSELQ